MQIQIFQICPIFKYDFWENTQYSNMIFWCFLVTPGYFIDISKKADISTIDIDISSKKHEKTLISAENNGFFTQNVLIDIDIDIDIF